jgi:hypothetical protein
MRYASELGVNITSSQLGYARPAARSQCRCGRPAGASGRARRKTSAARGGSAIVRVSWGAVAGGRDRGRAHIARRVAAVHVPQVSVPVAGRVHVVDRDILPARPGRRRGAQRGRAAEGGGEAEGCGFRVSAAWWVTRARWVIRFRGRRASLLHIGIFRCFLHRDFLMLRVFGPFPLRFPAGHPVRPPIPKALYGRWWALTHKIIGVPNMRLGVVEPALGVGWGGGGEVE